MSTTHSVTRKPLPAHTAGPAAPEWEAAEEGEVKKLRFGVGAIGGSATGWAISDRFDRVLPPHKRYFGRSRRVLLIAIGVIFLLLLALIIGLAMGLSKKSKYISSPSALVSLTNNSQGQNPPATKWRENIHGRVDVLRDWHGCMWHCVNGQRCNSSHFALHIRRHADGE
jgi:hypothetical protein